MAIMIPDVLRETTVSIGERRLFNRFKRELSDDYTVLHSLGITEHPAKLWAEADYVVISPQGIYIIEVKSGSVSCHEGIWTYADRNGISTRKPEGPFEQAKNAMYSIKDEIEKNAIYRGFLYGYGVIMPDEDFKSEGPEIERGVLLDRNNWNRSLSKYLQKIEKFWSAQYKGKHVHEPRLPTKGEREAVRKILRPNIYTTHTLASKLNSIDRQLIELTNEQLRTVRGMENNPRTVIQGGAGTGKTILAFDRALSLAGKGEKVLLLCFNRLLADNFVENLPDDLLDSKLITADSIHNYFRSVIESAGKHDRINQKHVEIDELYSKVYPEVYMDCMMENAGMLYDAVVIDEAQDVMTHEYLDALDLSLNGGLTRGHWHLFVDKNQNIYGADSAGPEKRLRDIGFAEFTLCNNCRNTVKVAVQTSIVSGIPVPLNGTAEGGESKVIYYKNRADFLSKLETEIENMLKNGLHSSDFIILSTRTFENSSLRSLDSIASLRVRDLTRDRRPLKTAIDFCTMHSFKGLERKAVIAIDVLNILEKSNSILLYAGLSRARSYLSVFLHETESSNLQSNAGKFGTWLAENKPDNIYMPALFT